MQRIAHGSTSLPESSELAGAEDNAIHAIQPSLAAPNVKRFCYLFGDLQTNPDHLLPETSETLDNLARLGDTMRDKGATSGLNSTIPAIYTYFGQFLDHDITFTKVPKGPRDLTDSCMLGDSLLVPWPKQFILREVENLRNSILELDSIYGCIPPASAPPRNPHKNDLMALGKVSAYRNRPAGKCDDNDLPRGPMMTSAARDRVALIGDPRNDQNLIISQMHVAFLRAHNNIVEQEKCDFDAAQALLRQHYHWIIIHDYLKKRIADPDIVDDILTNGNKLYHPSDDEFCLPLEFTVAAFRFGHSMIRSIYYLNVNYQGMSLTNLFTLTALSNNIFPTPGMGFENLPEDRIIQWEKFVEGYENENMARLIDTRLVEPLRTVLDEAERPVPCETRLAVQDLKRGYMMRMPTGQAVANKLGLHVLTAVEIEAVLKDNPSQLRVLRDSGFLERTPLWFYLLVEAAQGGGNRLGIVGSQLVAEVLIGLVRRSKDSILRKSAPPWSPTLGKVKGVFDLPDLLRLAGVLN